jgi:hypothetical protein
MRDAGLVLAERDDKAVRYCGPAWKNTGLQMFVMQGGKGNKSKAQPPASTGPPCPDDAKLRITESLREQLD